MTLGALAFTLAFGVLVAPQSAVEAQQPGKVYRIGMLNISAIDPAVRPALVVREQAFKDGLRAHGWVEGQNIVIERRHVGGRVERLPELAAELVRLGVDVLVTSSGDPAINTLKQATSTIPIVMVLSADPVGSALVQSLARPGGNVTGLSLMAVELGAKRLQFLKEAVPRASRVAVLWNAASPDKGLELRNTEAAAQSLGVTLRPTEVRVPGDFAGAFSAILKGRPHALVVFSEPLTSSHQKLIVEFALKNRLPIISEVKEFAESGALMTYGPNFPEMYRQAASYVDRILRGAPPASLPVQQPTKFEFVINMKTAKALGLTIPPSLLLRADQVIE